VNDLRQVVVGIDGSESAARAVDWLQQFPLPDRCQVHFVTLMPFLEGLSPTRKLQWPAQFRALYQEQYEEARQQLEAMAASWPVAGQPGVAALRSGDPADGLLRYADEQQADLIVLGSRGMGAIERFLLGSTSEKVLRHSQASTLIVR
jgi:nucleotide-binding universal stress UspA family protein